ncbi:squalene monooxygenase isoform 2 [Corchorus olitorius]|uniref:Squalene monooxygenase isoform 2 n=1 Tax=Corchorus olitorius TaxID=93759 RepID=A0A1R3GAZ5_9ROSI|nr:squalene monooxygenase isoform 2 [Corchorus olitorius]
MEEQELDESSPSIPCDWVNHGSELQLESHEKEDEIHNSLPTKFIDIEEEEAKTTTSPSVESALNDLDFIEDMVPSTFDTPSLNTSVGESECASSIQEALPREDSNLEASVGDSPFVESLQYEDPDFLGIERFLEFGCSEEGASTIIFPILKAEGVKQVFFPITIPAYH